MLQLLLRRNQNDLNVGLNTDKEIVLNRTVFFDPTGNVGLGTTAGVGIISTISVTTPGLGTTDLAIPLDQSIFPTTSLLLGSHLLIPMVLEPLFWFQMTEQEQALELPLDSLTIRPFIQSISAKT